MKLKKDLDGIITLENQKMKSKDNKSTQWELTESAIELWEEKRRNARR